MTKFEEVKNQTTEEYFNGNQFAIDAFNRKYKITDTETYVEAIWRVCRNIASVESGTHAQEFWANRWFDEIYNDWWHPAGSIMQGAGAKRKISMANCTTLSLGALDESNEWDNLESIIKNGAYTVAKTAAYRQGLGIDFSRLRPAEMKVHNSSNESSGVTHWMKLIDSLGYFVGQKGRIPAMLFSLNIGHPDIIDFIDVKKDYTQIQNANISIQMTDAFYRAVENNEVWQMQFIVPPYKKGDRIYIDSESAPASSLKDESGKSYSIATSNFDGEIISKDMKARKLLKLISKAMLKNAEPGIQNIDIARRFSNSDAVYDKYSDFDSRIISTNACSEQYLNREGLCILLSVNAIKFAIGMPDVTEEAMNQIAYSMVRFGDNVNTFELKNKTYATQGQKESIEQLRRVGCGITNLAGYLFECGFEYGSEQGNNGAERLVHDFNYFLYKATIEIGREKGSFKAFDPDKIKKSEFIQHMMKQDTFTFPQKLKFDAMRNVCVSSIAPTGTLSLMFSKSVMGYGIEPSFGPYYWKRSRLEGDYKYYFVIPKAIQDWYNKNKAEEMPPYDYPECIEDEWDGNKGLELAKNIDDLMAIKGVVFKKDTDVNAFDKLELMKGVMKNIDSSISVTYNLPEDVKEEVVYKFILKAHEAGVKSVAVFPDRKMYGIVSTIPFKKLAVSLQAEGVKLHDQNFSKDESNELNIVADNVSVSGAPKRPTKMESDIYAVTVRGEKFVLSVGLLNGAPYEMFGGHMNGLDFKFNKRSGCVEKVSRGVYKLEFDDHVVEDFNKQFTPVEVLMFRMISMNLRHGVPIKHIVEQLEKSSDDILSFSAAASRVLKKYIQDGEQATGVECPSCHNTNSLEYQDGCVTCSICDWGKC